MKKINIWNFWATIYDQLPVLQKHSLKPTRDFIISEMRPYLKKEKKYKLLDMGCGTAQLLEEIEAQLPEYDIEYTGVDMSPEMISTSQEKFSHAEFIHCSVDDFSADNETFDFITCSHSFPYYPEKEAVIEKFHALLKPDGVLLLVHASINNLYDRFSLGLIKLGAWEGDYPGIPRMVHLLREKFHIKKIFRVSEKIWMSCISFFVCEKK